MEGKTQDGEGDELTKDKGWKKNELKGKYQCPKTGDEEGANEMKRVEMKFKIKDRRRCTAMSNIQKSTRTIEK